MLSFGLYLWFYGGQINGDQQVEYTAICLSRHGMGVELLEVEMLAGGGHLPPTSHEAHKSKESGLQKISMVTKMKWYEASNFRLPQRKIRKKL